MSILELLLVDAKTTPEAKNFTKNDKNIDKDFFAELLEKISKSQDAETTTKETPDKSLNIKLSKTDEKTEPKIDLRSLLSENTTISNEELQQIVKTKNDSQKEEITAFTKKTISAYIKLNNIKMSEKEIQEFKNIDSFDKLVKFANKKNLNISKIVLTKDKYASKNEFKNAKTDNPQILGSSPKPKKMILPQTQKQTKTTPNDNNSHESKLSTLLTPKKTQKQPKKSDKTESHETKNAISQTNSFKKEKTKNIQLGNDNTKYENELQKENPIASTQVKNVKTQESKKEIQRKEKQLSRNEKTPQKPTVQNDTDLSTSKKEKTAKLETLLKPNLEKKNDSHSQQTLQTQTPQILNTAQQIDTRQIQYNITKAKQTLKHFATDLKKAIDDYKPPISKLSIELNPKDLGKVEVTIIHRGDNLQVSINSNNHAINLFNAHQQELKQNLVNLGYSDVNMSFNQQSKQQQGNREYKQNQKFSNQEEEELVIEIPIQYA